MIRVLVFGGMLNVGRAAESLLLAGTNAESTQTRSSRYSLRRWTTEDGLPQNVVNALAQTPDGYLWCGTHVGLARFDGRRFVVFDNHNTPALASSDTIYSLAVDVQGVLWIATARGLVRFAHARFEAVEPLGGWKGQGVTWVEPSRRGGVWVASSVGLFHALGHEVERVDKPVPQPNYLARLRIHETESGILFWSDAAHSSLMVQSRSQVHLEWKTVSMPVESGTHAGFALGVEDARLWVVAGDRFGALEMDGSIKTVSLPNDLMSRGITGAWQTEVGCQWFSDRAGRLWNRTRRGVELVVTAPELDCRQVGALVRDMEQNVWVSTPEGLCRIRPRQIETIGMREGLPSDVAWSVCAGTDGQVWVSTEAGVVGIRGSQVERRPALPQWSTLTLRSVLETRDGKLYLAAGDPSGTRWLDHGQGEWRSWEQTERSADGLYEDRSGRLWCLGREGASRWDGSSWARWGRSHSVPIFDVRVAHQSADGAMWFGQRHGALIWMDEESGRTVRLDHTHGLTSDEIWCVHETEDRALWVGTRNGLHRVPPELVKALRETPKEAPGKGRVDEAKVQPSISRTPSIFAFRAEHGMPDDAVNWILPDDQGHFWLSGLRGIHRVRRDELEALVRGRRSDVSCSTFGVADGMPTAETNGEHQPAGCRSADGRLWFPTGKGVVVIDPSILARSEAPSRSVLEEVEVDGELVWSNLPQMAKGVGIPAGILGEGSVVEKAVVDSVEGVPRVHLGPGRAKVVRISYTASSLVHADKVRFRHRLRGMDEQWREAGTVRTADYHNLRPGHYSFDLETINPEGVRSSSLALVQFTLVPSFVQTRWFPITLTAMGAGVAFGLSMWRLRWQRRLLQAERQRDLERERARIARDMHDDLGSRLARVSLLSELALRPDGVPSQTTEQVVKIAATTRETMVAMEELVWSVDPTQDTTMGVVRFLGRWVEEFAAAADLRCRVEVLETLPVHTMDSLRRQACLLGVKESLRNVVKHAQATEVRLRVQWVNAGLKVEVCDNGKGCANRDAPDTSPTFGGRGLRNIEQRIKEVGGTVDWVCLETGGTTVAMWIPFEPEHRP